MESLMMERCDGNSDGKGAVNVATLDRDFPRKIPREKFRTKINTPRARENVRELAVVTLVQHTTEIKFITLAVRHTEQL
jgi:hypothetical protein